MTTSPTELIPLRITVQAANVEDNAAATAFRPIPRGTIKDIVWQFPVGSNGHIYVVVESRSGQIAPISGEAMALGGGPPLPFTGLNIPVQDREAAVRLVAWVDAGASYPTTVDVFLVVEASEVA